MNDRASYKEPPTIDECLLTTQNWVITCATQMIQPIARISTELKANPTPWSKYSRWRHNKRTRYEQEPHRNPPDYYREQFSTSVSKPVGGLYGTPDSHVYRTNFAINLQETAVRMRHIGVQYNPMSIHALILKFRRPSAAVLVFSAGRVVCTGAKTHIRAVYLLNVTIRLLRQHGHPGLRITPGSWKVRNVVASAKIPARINILKLYEANRQFCSYDPDIFPGVPFRKPQPQEEQDSSAKDTKKSKTTILVFDTGSLVITGAKTEEGLASALKRCIDDIWAARVVPRRTCDRSPVLQ